MTERTASAGGVVGDELADPQAYQAASRAWSARTTRPAVQATTGTFVPALRARVA